MFGERTGFGELEGELTGCGFDENAKLCICLHGVGICDVLCCVGLCGWVVVRRNGGGGGGGCVCGKFMSQNG